ncbi:DUF302 domain-containing protein [Sulfurimonas sp.]|uniref:DUF302 domain-containing protein n=1 Tax=Sulfurimonas sp. TaxID=2022749 RepID=UPI002635BF14|nr:DUF302 domain-containing protein [Sulfurimonas sp.]MCW8896166.1 DUF302 domain-containing protein [Sulfurimonas sp.]MCW9068406.1 DUF302 domain-containing protein [Sulfurimonas sp.]
MLKRILIGLSPILIATMFSGCTMMKMGVAYMGFPSEAQTAYAEMMGNLSKTGDPAQAMMKEWKVADDVSEEDVFEAMREYAGEYNMRFVGEKNMFTIENGKPDEIVHARIGEFCSLSIAKKMFNHSRYYGGFMPCRIVYVEYGNGDRYLISMDMTLALYGGTDKKPISPDLLEDMKSVKTAMEEIPRMAAAGE